MAKDVKRCVCDTRLLITALWVLRLESWVLPQLYAVCVGAVLLGERACV